MNDDRIFDHTKWTKTIQALLASAADPAYSDEVQQAYAAKAAELMTRFGIERARLRTAGGDHRPGTAEVWSYAVPGSNGLGPARGESACRIAEAMGCKALLQLQPTPRPCTVMLTGVTADITALKTLLPLLLRQAELAAATAAAAGRRAPSFLSSFLSGYGRAVAGRITERRRAYATAGSGAELVLAGRERAVADLYRATFGHLTLVDNPAGRQRADGLAAGRAAGTRADLGDARLGDHQRPALPGTS